VNIEGVQGKRSEEGWKAGMWVLVVFGSLGGLVLVMLIGVKMRKAWRVMKSLGKLHEEVRAALEKELEMEELAEKKKKGHEIGVGVDLVDLEIGENGEYAKEPENEEEREARRILARATRLEHVISKAMDELFEIAPEMCVKILLRFYEIMYFKQQFTALIARQQAMGAPRA
jgi:hypothetical protein